MTPKEPLKRPRTCDYCTEYATHKETMPIGRPDYLCGRCADERALYGFTSEELSNDE